MTDIEQSLDALFSRALTDGRQLTAREVMASIGLQRTNIYGTYAHVEARRKRHNDAVRLMFSAADPVSSRSMTQETPAQLIARLRRESKTARELADTYAEEIRRLTLENYQLRLEGLTVVDSRERFSRGRSDDMEV